MNLDECFDIWKDRINILIKSHPLQIISWEATRRCNQKCVHCGSPAEFVDLEQELSTEEVISAFDQIAESFDMSQFRHINITGGEPFVRSDLVQILKHLYRYPFFRNIDIQTNGLVPADHSEIIDEVKRFGVTGLGVSIDGLEKTHNDFRTTKKGFEKAVKAAKLSVVKGLVTTVSVVAHAKNIDEIPFLYDFVKKQIRPRVFRIMTIDPIGRAEFDQEYLLSPDQTRQVIQFLQNKYKETCSYYSDPKTMMVELGCGGWLGKELEGTVRPLIFHCIAGLNNLGILFDGKLGSCSNISREFIEGDLRQDSIRDVWENRYKRYRNFEWKRTGPCLECNEWDYCHGGPMHLNYKRHSFNKCILKNLNASNIVK